MTDTGKLCLEAMNALGWPYASPGSNNEKGIDCSGLLVYAAARQRVSLPHGSNSLWRKSLMEKGRLESTAPLQCGMAVFRHREGTPKKFRDSEGDFYHVGLVVSEHPLRILHASSVSGKVVLTASRRGWSHWGMLKNARRITLIPGMKGEDVRLLQQRLIQSGHSLKADGIYGPKTKAAVTAFQQNSGLAADGIAGEKTRKRLACTP
ncbi:MAG: peptidoglycan-binding protein [Clostridia bacterium]|nr:peptidoglycan-binding protein [Clostridia bacterium]